MSLVQVGAVSVDLKDYSDVRGMSDPSIEMTKDVALMLQAGSIKKSPAGHTTFNVYLARDDP